MAEITLPIGVWQNQPPNPNFLNTHRFRVVLRRAPSIVYFVQECNLPGISMGNATQPTPFTDVPVPGDKVQFSEFTMSFPIDEDMKNYKEIANWIIGLGVPKQFGQYKDLTQHIEGIQSVVTLMILDSNSNPQHIVNFEGAFPVSLSEIGFSTMSVDTVIPIVTATFKYAYWQFDEVNADTDTVTQADRMHY